MLWMGIERCHIYGQNCSHKPEGTKRDVADLTGCASLVGSRDVLAESAWNSAENRAPEFG